MIDSNKNTPKDKWDWDFRTDKETVPTIADVPSIPLDRYSVNGLATTAFLQKLSELVAVHVYNELRMELDESPCIGNDGRRFDNDRFFLHAYSWADDELANVANFFDRKTGAAVSWYKYVPRGLCINAKFRNLLDNDLTANELRELHDTLNA